MAENPKLPPELKTFEPPAVQHVVRKKLSDAEELNKVELRDVNQQIFMRPVVAIFFGALLIAQNAVVFKIIWWALESDKLADLQLVFSVLVSATLFETYKVSQIIVNRLFEQIDYKDKHGRFRNGQKTI